MPPILLLIAVVIGIIIAIVNAVSRPSLSKFDQLGDIRGKTLDQVIGTAGLPQSYSTPAPGKVLAQWICPGFHVALLFEYRGPKGEDWGKVDEHRQDFICLGITHQFGR